MVMRRLYRVNFEEVGEMPIIYKKKVQSSTAICSETLKYFTKEYISNFKEHKNDFWDSISFQGLLKIINSTTALTVNFIKQTPLQWKRKFVRVRIFSLAIFIYRTLKSPLSTNGTIHYTIAKVKTKSIRYKKKNYDSAIHLDVYQKIGKVKSQVGHLSRGRSEGSLFNSYYTEV